MPEGGEGAGMLRGGGWRNKDGEAGRGGGVGPTVLSSVTIPFVVFFIRQQTHRQSGRDGGIEALPPQITKHHHSQRRKKREKERMQR